MRRALLAGTLAVVLAGCGSRPPDLFVVQRSGADRNANVELLVSDGGSVKCNGHEHELDAERLLTARQLVRDLSPQAELAIALPKDPGQRAQLPRDDGEGHDRVLGPLAGGAADVPAARCVH